MWLDRQGQADRHEGTGQTEGRKGDRHLFSARLSPSQFSPPTAPTSSLLSLTVRRGRKEGRGKEEEGLAMLLPLFSCLYAAPYLLLPPLTPRPSPPAAAIRILCLPRLPAESCLLYPHASSCPLHLPHPQCLPATMLFLLAARFV